MGAALVLGLFGVTAYAGATLNGGLDAFRAAYGEPRHLLAKGLGFGLDKVTISGLAELREAEVLQAAGIDARLSLPFLDAVDLRDRLLRLALVKEATVRKLFPSELSIALVEREPFALWQRDGEVVVVAADGATVTPLEDERFNRLPLVVGAGANLKARAYVALLDGAGDLRGHIRAGILVGGRRWNLKLDNGADVRLPEAAPAAALQRLGALVREARLLDKDVVLIDLRQPDRVVVRLSDEAADAHAEAMKKKIKPKGGES